MNKKLYIKIWQIDVKNSTTSRRKFSSLRETSCYLVYKDYMNNLKRTEHYLLTKMLKHPSQW